MKETTDNLRMLIIMTDDLKDPITTMAMAEERNSHNGHRKQKDEMSLRRNSQQGSLKGEMREIITPEAEHLINLKDSNHHRNGWKEEMMPITEVGSEVEILNNRSRNSNHKEQKEVMMLRSNNLPAR
jgi:hypothetical protein